MQAYAFVVLSRHTEHVTFMYFHSEEGTDSTVTAGTYNTRMSVIFRGPVLWIKDEAPLLGVGERHVGKFAE